MKHRRSLVDCIGGREEGAESPYRKWWRACAVVMVAAGLSWPAEAEPIQLRPAQVLQDGGAVLLPGKPGSGFAIPCVADWNKDGKKDLLVGFQDLGEIAFYENLGTDAQPCFTNFTVLKAGGQVIKLTAGGCGSPAPWVCDFDGDGKQDLLVGDGETGKVWFYRNTNSTPNATPMLAPGVALQVGTSDLTVGARATPYVCDWDEDGLPDLLCGDINGYVWFFRNTNTVQAPIFASGVKLQASGTNLCLAGSLGGVGRSVVRVYDWDGDGLKDLVCSSDGGVYWCRNTNNNSNPILQSPVPILVPTASCNCLVPISTANRMRIDLADWNDDGVMDLILGDASGMVYYFEGYRFAFTRVGPQPGGPVVLQWNSASNLSYDILTGAAPASLLTEAVTNLPSAGNTTLWTNTAAGNQQYYRVQIAP